MVCNLIRVKVQPNAPPFGFAPIEYHTHPKTVAILESYRELLFETAHLEAIPMSDFHGMSDGKSFQQVHEFFPSGWVRYM